MVGRARDESSEWLTRVHTVCVHACCCTYLRYVYVRVHVYVLYDRRLDYECYVL